MSESVPQIEMATVLASSCPLLFSLMMAQKLSECCKRFPWKWLDYADFQSNNFILSPAQNAGITALKANPRLNSVPHCDSRAFRLESSHNNHCLEIICGKSQHLSHMRMRQGKC
jgi:hypothetical protein